MDIIGIVLFTPVGVTAVVAAVAEVIGSIWAFQGREK